MKYIDFKNDNWENNGLVYAYSNRFRQTPKFTQKNGYIVSSADKDMPGGYDWIGLLTQEKYSKSCKITTRCYFESYGAPLIVLANDLTKDKNGVYRIGEYIEIVIYENGVNVWKHTMVGDTPKWKLLMGVEFEVPSKKIVTLSSQIKDNLLIIEAEGKRMQLDLPGIPDEIHAGIIACEGINRFYDIKFE